MEFLLLWFDYTAVIGTTELDKEIRPILTQHHTKTVLYPP